MPPGEAVPEMYDRDEIDILYPYGHLSFRDARRAIQLHPDDYISGPNPMTIYLGFNVRKPPSLLKNFRFEEDDG